MDYVSENIRLNDLFRTENISNRTRNICEYNGLTNINSILKFYFENHTFKNLRNCGNNSNEELIRLCKKYQNLQIEPIVVNDNVLSLSIKHLFLNNEISIRSKNCCGKAGLHTIGDIIDYYKSYNTFKRIDGCGESSNEELIEVCQKYMRACVFEFNEKYINPIKEQIDSLSARQRKILNNLIESQSRSLSVRSLNAIENFTEHNLTVGGLKEILIDENYNLNLLRNIGKKSVDELTQFFKEIRGQIEIIQLFEDEDELIAELFNTYLRKKFCLNSNDIVQIWNRYESKNGLPVFKSLDVLMSNGYLHKGKKQEIFKRAFKFWTNASPEKLEDISLYIGLTRERTRQIRKKLLDEIDSEFSFLKGLEFDALNLYGIDVDSEIIVIDENLIDEIQQKESVRFNNIFVTKILSILINETHTLVGNLESCAFNSAKPKGLAYRWKSIYLVNKEIEKIFNFEAFAIDIYRRLTDRIEEDYSFHFETYLISFLNEGFEAESFIIIQIAEYIIFNEFEITIDTLDQITFKRNTKKQVIEYVYDILKEKNEPLDIYQIFDILVSKHPNVTKSAEALRGSCQRDSKLIYFGRSSTYGLREWEKCETVKGGTMHDIAEEFLLQFNTPKHINEIKKYVSRFRANVTSKNLLYNLKSAENRRFHFFKNAHIGLVGKSYNEEFLRNNKNKIVRRTWDENFELLTKFTDDFNRLPSSSGTEEEQKLYRFMNVQLNKKKTEQIKVDKINELVSNYGYVRRTRRNPKDTDTTYLELIQFIETNKRLPNSRKDEERSLYRFFYRQAKLYNNGELAPNQENMFIKLKEIIKCYEN